MNYVFHNNELFAQFDSDNWGYVNSPMKLPAGAYYYTTVSDAWFLIAERQDLPKPIRLEDVPKVYRTLLLIHK